MNVGTIMNNTEDKTASRRAEFSDALADEILARLTDGKSLSSICSDDGLPSYRTIMRRIGDDETFRERYELARRIQAERFADELVTIADDGRNDTYTDKDGNVQVDCDHIQRA